jgi:hypothetical protein
MPGLALLGSPGVTELGLTGIDFEKKMMVLMEQTKQVTVISPCLVDQTQSVRWHVDPAWSAQYLH